MTQVSPSLQGYLLPAEERIAQPVDRMAPQVFFLLPWLARRPRGGGEHSDDRADLQFGRAALDELDVRLVRVLLFDHRLIPAHSHSLIPAHSR